MLSGRGLGKEERGGSLKPPPIGRWLGQMQRRMQGQRQYLSLRSGLRQSGVSLRAGLDAGLKPCSISRARAAAENAGGLDVSAIWAVFWDLYVGPSALGFVGLGT